jgi:UDP:flavonoid glycosyltransferase YjiC (YdhE family)
MRVLFATTGHAGHLLPLVPFARACLRAGHEVAVACERPRTGAVERLGLTARPFDVADPAAWASLMAPFPTLAQPDGDALIIGAGFAGIGTRAALPGVLAIVEDWRPDVVVRESYHFAGALAAERHGIPHARVALGLASTERWAADLAAASVDRLRRTLGLRPDPAGERLWRSPLLTSVPAGFDDGPGLRFGAGAATRAASLPDVWPNAHDPLVYLTFGSVTASLPYFPDLYRAALEALAALPVRVLLTLGESADPAALGPLPANAHVERWRPQEDVLPHAAAVIGHGGFGTTLGALAHGLPLVVLPLFAGDQWRNARRVARIGAGLALAGPVRRSFDPPGPALLAALPGAVEAVLGPSAPRRVAGRLAAAIAALPPADAAVPRLEALAADGPRRLAA